MKKIIYFIIFFSIAFIFFVLSIPKLNSIFFYVLCIIYITSRYWKQIFFLRDTLEIVILYFSLTWLSEKLQLYELFPANSIFILVFLLLFIFFIKHENRANLFFKFRSTKNQWRIIILFSLISIGGLVSWFIFYEKNIYEQFMPRVPLFLLIPMGIGFAVFNSFFEETIFRSILFSSFLKEIDDNLAIILQAIWFSFLHYQSGFPSGVSGIFLTFMFGSIMGILTFKQKSIFIPVIIHAIADFSIFILILLRMHNII